MIDEIWIKFDKDNSGYLDKQETRNFLKNILGSMGEREFSEDDFFRFFTEFDSDNNGIITKNEMRRFIVQVIGQKEASQMTIVGFTNFKKVCFSILTAVESDLDQR